MPHQADAYSAENESNLVNAYYERPAMLKLAGTWPKDWVPTLGELRRVLKPGGRLIVSVDIPW